jgi:hypothetical protein
MKANRLTEYGHKVCLTTGASAIVTDVIVETGNPADATLAVKMIERQKELFGKAPKQASFDGGFATRSNLAAIKALGVEDAAFHKRRGIEVKEMTSSDRIYKKLRNFRAGIEGGHLLSQTHVRSRTLHVARLCLVPCLCAFERTGLQPAGHCATRARCASLKSTRADASRRAHVDADGQRASCLTGSARRRVCRSILRVRGPLEEPLQRRYDPPNGPFFAAI